MRKEIKITLPVYKVVYSICFIFILSLVRGVAYTNEIGIALEAPIAILAIAFCSDTYVMEILSKRSEVSRLYPIKIRTCSQYKRMLIQVVYLFFASLMGYGLFWIFQRPLSEIDMQDDAVLFFMYMAAIIVTISFWGTLSNVIACLARNIWGGIGCSMLLWLAANSKAGDALLGKWNLFSYAFYDVEKQNNMGWMCGKIVCVCLTIFFMALLPVILKKRG